MKRTKKMTSSLGGFPSGATLGGKVSRYRDKEHIYRQGARSHFFTFKKEACGSAPKQTSNRRQLPPF